MNLIRPGDIWTTTRAGHTTFIRIVEVGTVAGQAYVHRSDGAGFHLDGPGLYRWLRQDTIRSRYSLHARWDDA